LAEATEDLGTGDRGMSDDSDSPVFMRVFLSYGKKIDGILLTCFPLRCLIWMGLILRH
jgi:hypothetical protein